MSRREVIRYSESSEDEDYENPRSNDGQTGYYDYHGEEKLRKSLAKVARLHEGIRRKAAAISSVRRLPSPGRTTASHEPARARESYSSDEVSGEDDEVIEANGRTYVFDGNEIRLDQKYVGGHNRPGHSTSSKLRRHGPRSLSDVCNKDTISKDNTVGNQAQMDELLATFGKKVLGTHCHELPDTGYTFGLLSPVEEGDAKPGRNTTRRKTPTGIQRRQRQQLTQDEYGDEADADLRDTDPASIPEAYEDKANMAFDYIQAARARVARVATDQYAKAEKDLESDNDSSHSEFGAEFDDIGDYDSEYISDDEFQRPITVRSRERRIPAARPS
ncbi:uncharacterized protein FTOL_11054 [Fusarium torulosum]|uniref:Uncharacterized protein n=1 Tax=Fusarium torulosum TaxID=33205 RepID=A0AAE8SML6_9HYPO|nr:uncharacterized protein FTOL_11054 [Fusarium torulosum]